MTFKSLGILICKILCSISMYFQSELSDSRPLLNELFIVLYVHMLCFGISHLFQHTTHNLLESFVHHISLYHAPPLKLLHA